MLPVCVAFLDTLPETCLSRLPVLLVSLRLFPGHGSSPSLQRHIVSLLSPILLCLEAYST